VLGYQYQASFRHAFLMPAAGIFYSQGPAFSRRFAASNAASLLLKIRPLLNESPRCLRRGVFADI